MEWQDVEKQARWMPIGRKSDAKAPAFGYKTSAPQGWVRRELVVTELAGLNFGAQVGQDAAPWDVVGIDLDFKPELAIDGPSRDLARERLNACLALPGLMERSVSGYGRHIFGAPDDALREWVGKAARKSVVLMEGKLGQRKACAALEVFGGGNAYIAVTGQWGKGARGPRAGVELPEITLEALAGVLGDRMPRVAPKRAGGVSGAKAGGSGPIGGVDGDGVWRPRAEYAGEDKTLELVREIAREYPLPAGYGEWLALMAAARDGGMSEGEFDEWSARSPNYTAGEVGRIWPTLAAPPQSGGAPARVGSLIHWAKGLGWLTPAQRNRDALAGVRVGGGVLDSSRGGWAPPAWRPVRAPEPELEPPASVVEVIDCVECGGSDCWGCGPDEAPSGAVSVSGERCVKCGAAPPCEPGSHDLDGEDDDCVTDLPPPPGAPGPHSIYACCGRRGGEPACGVCWWPGDKMAQKAVQMAL